MDGSAAVVHGITAKVTEHAATTCASNLKLIVIGVCGCRDVAIHLCWVVFAYGAEDVEHRCRAIDRRGLMRHIGRDDEQRTGLDDASLITDRQSPFFAEQDAGLG